MMTVSKKTAPKPIDPNARFLSIPDSAGYMCMSAANVWAIIARQELPVIRVGKRTLLDKTDLDAFLLARKTKAA